jgi:hypothetical protein
MAHELHERHELHKLAKIVEAQMPSSISDRS